MGLETRRNGTAYYYRKERIGGHVVSRYVAGGALGRLLAAADQAEREQQATTRAAERTRLTAALAEEQEARQLAADCQQLAALALLAAGHHRHKGTWRRRRYDPMAKKHDPLAGLSPTQLLALQEAERRRKAEAALPPLPAPGDDSPEARKAILARCDRSDASAEDVAALRALLARDRAASSLVGPLQQALSIELEQRFKHLLKRELLRDHLNQRRAELGYDSAPALEKPLILHLLLCELRLGNAETVYTATTTVAGGVTLNQADYADRQLNAAQARYLAAVKALAQVRRVRVELARVLPDGSAEAVAVERPGA